MLHSSPSLLKINVSIQLSAFSYQHSAISICATRTLREQQSAVSGQWSVVSRSTGHKRDVAHKLIAIS
ncbi:MULTISPECIES: hypothetical protein [unclassified Moorena]|uniref:hypothetical protein n=1 Tax=unclassified Moorena TaxID=2683338 RepID=UPI0013BBE5C5|nr:MULTISPECIES: hypothetical protein [unclassified Moorena]NEP33442.1 hypothetical protein [Moorena sp. SIO3B2]NEQ05946.1 hypothetical protein [Moorena sp. SIO4E2]NER90588.1 hypothetical protein [Moorena sp. SIO3A2]NET67203.1 hypothetical protein [Moorena sp. SIO1G6]